MKKIPDSLRALAESVKYSVKRLSQRDRAGMEDQPPGNADHPRSFQYEDYSFHNSVRRSGGAVRQNRTSKEESDAEGNNLDATESTKVNSEKNYDYEYDYEDEEVEESVKDKKEGEENEPEYYYYYYYEYPDEGIDISHEIDKNQLYEPLPTPLWQKAENLTLPAKHKSIGEKA